MTTWNERPEALIETLGRHGVRRAYVITRASGRAEASHPFLEPLAEAVTASDDYFGHEGCFFEIGGESGYLLSAYVHRARRGQAAGGVRFSSYKTLGDVVTDGLRLSRGMSQKCALAGLWWGGGKGVIAERPGMDHREAQLRRSIYRDYGRFLTGLCGCYVCAEDYGTTPEDMADIFATTRHTTCIPPELGGSGTPSRLTATGLAMAMQAALRHLGQGDLSGKTVGIQGLGYVTRYLVSELVKRGVGRIVGADVDPTKLEALRELHPSAPLELRLAERGDMSSLATPCDILAPNAFGGCLNPETIPTIRAPIVCGAANTQLVRTKRDAGAMKSRGIVYVPDFLVNRMGIVNCANEQYGVFEGDPAVQAHLERETPFGVYQRTLEVLRRADANDSTAAEEAERLADELAEEPHPIWPERGKRIIRYLVDSGWADHPT